MKLSCHLMTVGATIVSTAYSERWLFVFVERKNEKLARIFLVGDHIAILGLLMLYLTSL